MPYPNRATTPHLPARVRSVTDVTDHMREIELVGPDFPLLRSRPGAHLVVRVPAGDGYARRVYVAGESDTCRLVQRHLVEQRGWPRRSVHLQPQWAADRPGFGA